MDLGQLLPLIAKGDEEAFNRLYVETSGRVYAICLLILKKQELAEEIVQEVYLRIWQQSEKFSPDKGSPMAWMTTITRRMAIDRVRVLVRRGKMINAFEEHVETLVEDAAANGQKLDDEIWGCLEKINPERAKLILLAYYVGYTHEELAAGLNQPLGTVKSSIRRGLMSLKECLGV